MRSKYLIGLSFALVPLAACATTDPVTGSVDRHFGEATAWNKAAHIIDPDPVYAETGAKPGDNGAVAAGATKRYRTDQVKPVETLNTTTVTGASGGGSGPR